MSALRAQRAKAVLLIGSGFQDRAWERDLTAELDPDVRAGGRVAVLSRHRSLRADTVLPENRGGAAAPARALLELGHREFAVLSGPPELTTVSDRLAGFRGELACAGVRPAPERIVHGAFTRDGGYAAARALLARGERPTCVFAVTDVMAVGALAAFREAGVRVPRDVSLAGFDDIPLVRELSPPLTTVALPLAELGRQVLALALREPRGARSRVVRVAGEGCCARARGRHRGGRTGALGRAARGACTGLARPAPPPYAGARRHPGPRPAFFGRFLRSIDPSAGHWRHFHALS